MSKLNELKKQAIESTDFRGHDMGEWVDSKRTATSYCECHVCGMGVGVDTEPSPNGIDIGGEAVALHCNPYQVVHDNEVQFEGSYNNCTIYILNHQGQSVHWAQTYEGWSIRRDND